MLPPSTDPSSKPVLIYLVGPFAKFSGQPTTWTPENPAGAAKPVKPQSHQATPQRLNPPTAFAVSADGERLAWTWKESLHFTNFRGHRAAPEDWSVPLSSSAPITGLAFFDGSTISVLHSDGEPENHDFSDVRNPTVLGHSLLESHAAYLSHGPLIAFSSFSNKLGPERGTVGVMSVASKRPNENSLPPIDLRALTSLAVSPAGSVALGSPDGHVTIYPPLGDPKRSEPERGLLDTNRPVKALAFLSEDQVLAADDEPALYLLTAGSRTGRKIGMLRDQVAVLVASGSLVAWIGSNPGDDARVMVGEVVWHRSLTEDARVYAAIFSVVIAFISLILVSRPK